jgi:Ca2+-transporting ATPase
LLPLHLLWINLVTDGLPALALVVDPPEGDVMLRPPRKSDEPMLGRVEWFTVGFTGMVEAGAALAVFVWALESRGVDEARSLAFSTLVFSELFRSFAARSAKRVFWETGVFSNLILLGVVILSVLMQLGLHGLSITQRLFSLHGLTLEEAVLSLGIGLLPTTALELSKLVRRASKRHGTK